jgi:hypothetical protein
LPPERCRIVVAATLAATPEHGGWVWAVMQWVLGLRRLGHEVTVVDPVARLDRRTVGAFEAIASEFGLAGEAALVGARRAALPMSYGAVVDRCRRADLLFNLGGALADAEVLEAVGTRVYVDVDPGFTQVWHEVDGIDMGLDAHDHHVTVGLNVGRAGNGVPTCGHRWITTVPPVVLDRWRPVGRVDHHGLTTVANWRGYGPTRHDGVHYGQKAHSWRPLMEVARRSPLPCLPALAIHPAERADLAALDAHGWRRLDPGAAAGTPGAYRRFVRGSLGELAIAKSGYVASRSGWFSDRSACYLAAGRPVVAQDTGFPDHLPTGAGLLAFDGVEGAVDAIAAVAADYDRHRRAARAVACEHLDSDRVLGRLVGLTLGGGES